MNKRLFRYKPNVVRHGYTIIELLMVVALIAILASMGGVAFGSMRIRNQLNLSTEQVRTELLRARSREANGIEAGVYFESDRFVYFESASYSEGASGNLQTTLPGSITLSEITFVNDIATFDPLTGELENWSDPSRVVVTDVTTGKSKTVSVNQWGLVEVD